jgi:hypothetical protein
MPAMRRAILIAVLLALSGCGKSYQEALDYCTLNVARVFPKADIEESGRLICQCMIAEGFGDACP